jgi:hypothetical protein
MASARLLKFQEAAAKIPPNPVNAPEPIKPRGRPYVMSINSAEHDRVFRRTQSAKMAATGWQSRLKPFRSWCEIAALGAGLTVFMVACVFLATI